MLDDTCEVVLSEEPGASPLTGTGEDLRLGDDNFSFMRNGIAMHGATQVVRREGRTWYASSERLSKLLRSYIGEPLFSRSFLLFCVASLLVYYVAMHFTRCAPS